MANNKRIQIQHWHTTGSTAPSGTSLTNMLLGEIAIATKTGEEAIFIKNNDGSAVTFMTSAQTDSLITQKLSDAGIAGVDVISTLSQNLSEHINTAAGNKNDLTPKAGHVLLVSGDLNVSTNSGNGLAAAASHTHGQYLTGVTAGSGLAIVGIIENGDVELQLDSETNNKINSGVTAYGWGNHAESDYATNTSLNDHTGNTEIHVTKTKQDAWDNAADAINAFLDNNAAISGAVDTLKEINEYLTGTGTSVETLLKTLDELTDTVDNNTSAITQNRNNISLLTTSASTNATNITSLGQTIGQVSTNVSAINNKIGSGFTSNTITSEIELLKNLQGNYITSISADTKNLQVLKDTTNRYTISHTSANTETSTITATNTTTGLSFGSEFKIVDKIGYDDNGHVVSGSTQTLKLPTVPTATTNNYGTVKIQHGDLGIEYELLNSLSGIAADVNHHHSQYVKFTDLNGNTGNIITISCGTY